MLFRSGDYELKYVPRGTGKGPTARLPRLRVDKIPPKLVSFQSAGSSVEGSLGKELLTFPFTTENVGSIELGLPRAAGKLQLRAVDPPVGLEVEEAQKTLEMGYSQDLAGIGGLGLRLRSNGDWSTSYEREVADIGYLRSSFNSQLDWDVDLESSYPPFKGIVPTLNYGATQDGMRVKARFDKQSAKGVHSTYAVRNLPGKLAPMDFIHDASLRVAPPGSRHAVEVRAGYDRKLPKLPVRGSLSYGVRAGPARFEASVDFERTRLQAAVRRAELSASLGHRADLETGGLKRRRADLGLKVGPASATVRFREGAPKVRLDVAV